MRQILLGILLLLIPAAQGPPVEPIVRIGLTQNAATVTIRSAQAFMVGGRTTRSATFAAVLAVDPNANGPVAATDLQYRITARLDDGATVVMPADGRVRIEPPAAPLEIETRAYRGAMEIFGNAAARSRSSTNCRSRSTCKASSPTNSIPTTFGQLEALKAQAVAARTYIQRNMGQYSKEGYDICATDACQVYFGVLTEDPLATQAIMETRGVVATYEGRPINALYSSTCGGRTEDAEQSSSRRCPTWCRSSCEYKHPEMPFTTTRAFRLEGRRACGCAASGTSPRRRGSWALPRGEPASANPAALGEFIRQTFYPSVLTASELRSSESKGS